MIRVYTRSPIPARPCEQCGETFLPKFRRGRFCSRPCVSAHDSARYAAARPTVCIEEGCQAPPKGRGRRCGRHERLRYPEDPDKAKARQRRKTHTRKAVGRLSDLTLEHEQELRRKTRRCPLCKTYMTGKPYLPNSKELDHMVPLNARRYPHRRQRADHLPELQHPPPRRRQRLHRPRHPVGLRPRLHHGPGYRHAAGLLRVWDQEGQ